MIRFLFTVILWNLFLPVALAEGFPKFEAVTIDPHAGEVVYAVTVADVNNDQKPDIVALTETQVIWYESPKWTKHVILDNQTQPDNVCFAPHDIDGDGQVDFAIGAGWLHGKNTGTIQWITQGKNPDDNWNVHFIGEIPWTHRMRWADVLGTGEKQLVVSPLNKTEGDGVKLTAFGIPDGPKTDAWPRTVLNDSLNKMHNHWHQSSDSKPELTLTASEEGVHFVGVGKDSKSDRPNLTTQKLPNSQAAGEIKTGAMTEDNRNQFITTIEPMHGNKLVVYAMVLNPFRYLRGGDASQDRIVIDDTLGRGHALWTADMDGDGADEIILGHSDPAKGEIKGPGVYIYDAQNNKGTKWTKHVIDNGGIATEDLVAEDLNGDGKIDIVAGGRATHNVKLYINRGASSSK